MIGIPCQVEAANQSAEGPRLEVVAPKWLRNSPPEESGRSKAANCRMKMMPRPNATPRLNSLLLLFVLTLATWATFRPSLVLIDCQLAGGSNGDAEQPRPRPQQEQEQEQEQEQQQQQSNSILKQSGAWFRANNPIGEPPPPSQTPQLGIGENSIPPLPQANPLERRNELSKLERRIDRLEFALRKSLHQQAQLARSRVSNEQLQQAEPSVSKSFTQSASQEGGGDPHNSGPDPWGAPRESAQTDSINGAPKHQQPSGGGGGGGGSGETKLIDLSERLDLVEKFITITTSKMYELEQSLKRLQRCECRQSCSWAPHQKQDRRGQSSGSSGNLNETSSQQAITKADGQVWRDQLDKCNVCSCHAGQVACKRVACPAPKCDSPQLAAGKCCPVCFKSCTFKGRRVEHGQKLVINSNEQTCNECLCLDGRFKCQRVEARRRLAISARLQRETGEQNANELEEGEGEDEVEGEGEEDEDYENRDEAPNNYLDEQSPDGELAPDEAANDLQITRREWPEFRRRRRQASERSPRTLWRPNEPEEAKAGDDDGDDDDQSALEQAKSRSPRASPLFCPALGCPASEQFKLENDCCTYCRGFDFCSHDYLQQGHRGATRADGERAPSGRCHPDAQCTNTNASSALPAASESQFLLLSIKRMFKCECRQGFTGDGANSCTDIDECSHVNLNDCDPKSTICHNLPGSFECRCRAGYKPTLDQLELESEWADQLARNRSSGETQQTTRGQQLEGQQEPEQEQEQEQQTGQTFRGRRRRLQTVPMVRAGERRLLQRCQDIDECADAKLNRCHTQAKCINLHGSYRCQCKRGFLGNGFQCHKWFTSAPSVAAYLHRHQEKDQDRNILESSSSSGSSNNDDDDDDLSSRDMKVSAKLVRSDQEDGQESKWARANAPLAPLNIQDDELDDDQSDLAASHNSHANDQLDEQLDSAVPQLSDARWAPLSSAPYDSTAASGNSSQQPEANGNSPQLTLNTRTMFMQPPLRMPRPRPWWDEQPQATTTSPKPGADSAEDVTEKQMISRLSTAPLDQRVANQTQAEGSRTDLAPGVATSLSKQEPPPPPPPPAPAAATNRKESARFGSTASPELQSSGTSQTNKNASQATSAGQGHKRGTIIASASTSARRGSPSNGRAYSSHQHSKQLGVSSSAPPLVSSIHEITRPAQHLITAKPAGPLLQYLVTMLPTLATSILVFVYTNQVNWLRINHIVTIYSR